MKDVIQTILY